MRGHCCRKAKADGDDASPKAAKPRARKSKAKKEKEESAEEVKEEEEEDAADEEPLPDRLHNGAGEGALKAEEAAAGTSAQQAEGPALLEESHAPAMLPSAGASEVPEEDDYDDL